MIESLTLHQLRVLLVLIEEESVSGAARRLGVSQPAVSQALRGLRATMGDPILVGGTRGMVKTPRAEALEAPLRRTIRAIEGLVGGEGELDLARLRRRFTLGTWDGITLRIVPPLLDRALREAPGVEIDLRPVPPQGASGALEDGRLDLAVEVRPRAAPGIKQRVLFDDDFACLVRADHPAVGERLDLATFLALPHALVSPQGEGTAVVDRRLEELGEKRRVVLRIRYFVAAPLIVARSDCVLTLPRSLAESIAALAPLRVCDPPLALPAFRTFMVWHERSDHDPAHRWLREAVVSAATSGGNPPRVG
ncbi:MAG: LysR family transcriptional regulator, partial [Deltaproteobacteria bacterium]|nr:LysR family transcriptional regulator [Deltaproteobacteria bacterium]